MNDIKTKLEEIKNNLPVSNERYIGYGLELKLPSGRTGIELTLNNLEELTKEMKSSNRIKILVLPVKPHNVTDWRTHSVKVGNKIQNNELIAEH